jgi:hypothetical protein
MCVCVCVCVCVTKLYLMHSLTHTHTQPSLTHSHTHALSLLFILYRMPSGHFIGIMFNPCGHGGDTLGLCGYGPSSRMHMSVRVCVCVPLSYYHSLTHSLTHTHSHTLPLCVCAYDSLSLSLCGQAEWSLAHDCDAARHCHHEAASNDAHHRPEGAPTPSGPSPYAPTCMCTRTCVHVCMPMCVYVCVVPPFHAPHAPAYMNTRMCVYMCVLCLPVCVSSSLFLCARPSLCLSLSLSLFIAHRTTLLISDGSSVCVHLSLSLSLPGRCPLSLSLFCMHECMCVGVWGTAGAGWFVHSVVGFGRCIRPCLWHGP